MSDNATHKACHHFVRLNQKAASPDEISFSISPLPFRKFSYFCPSLSLLRPSLSDNVSYNRVDELQDSPLAIVFQEILMDSAHIVLEHSSLSSFPTALCDSRRSFRDLGEKPRAPLCNWFPETRKHSFRFRTLMTEVSIVREQQICM